MRSGSQRPKASTVNTLCFPLLNTRKSVSILMLQLFMRAFSCLSCRKDFLSFLLDKFFFSWYRIFSVIIVFFEIKSVHLLFVPTYPGQARWGGGGIAGAGAHPSIRDRMIHKNKSFSKRCLSFRRVSCCLISDAPFL